MPKVLIIDDNAQLVQLVGHFLSEAGFTVESASSGPEGLQKAIAEPPDAVIVDIMMPWMDGYQVCRRLRSDPRTARAVIVALTARGQPVDVGMALRSGADKHMVKPFKGSVMVDEIEQLLAERRPRVPPLGYQLLVLKLEDAAGATTLATNLGIALARDRRHLTVLADMAFPRGKALPDDEATPSGRVAQRLGLSPPDAWPSPPGEEAGDELLAAVVRHESQLFVLPAPAGAEQPETAQVVPLLEALRTWYDYVVIDTEYNLGPLAAALLNSSALILLLLTPNPRAIQAAQASLAAIRKWASPTLEVWPVLSKVHADQASLRVQVEASLGLPVRSVLPWSPAECEVAELEGQPVALSRPEAPLSTAIQGLADQLIQATSAKSMQETGA